MASPSDYEYQRKYRYYTAAAVVVNVYPDLLAKDEVLKSAVLMFQQHELIIKARMAELAEAEPD